jgi:hypothetical protein
MDRIDRIVGGAESACVLAMMDVLRSVLNETGDQRLRLIDVAKTALQESMARRVNLERPGCRSHLEQMLETIALLGAGLQAPTEAAPIDVEALVQACIDDVDLNDPNNFSKGDLETFLAEAGADMARRYSLSGKAFWLERTIYKGQQYLGIGTSSGPHPRFPGQDFNVFCTTQGYRTIKDVDADSIVFSEGRQLTIGEDRDQRSYFIRFAPIATERTWRFWASTNKNGMRKDVDSLKFTIQLDPNSAKGYVVTRMRGRTLNTNAQAQTH